MFGFFSNILSPHHVCRCGWTKRAAAAWLESKSSRQTAIEVKRRGNFLLLSGQKGESKRRVSGGCEVILCSLVFPICRSTHRHTCTHSPCVSILSHMHSRDRACICDSLLLDSKSLCVCMRTSRCRRRSLQPHSLESSFNLRSALCPAQGHSQDLCCLTLAHTH